MDQLNKIIKINRQQFDCIEPDDGHFERFKQKLMFDNACKPKKFTVKSYLKIASIVLLCALSGLYIAEHTINKVIKITKGNSEFYQTQDYYLRLVNQQVSTINNMQHLLNNEQKQLLVDELTQMDKLYLKMQDDLKAMPDDPRIIQAMVSHYKMKIEILNRIINDLDNLQQIKTNSNENIEI